METGRDDFTAMHQTFTGELPRKASAKNGLRKLFENELKDIYWAEKALSKALPKLIKKASAPELQDVISNHLEETKKHITSLEDVFKSLGKKATAKKCEAMAGLIKEASEIVGDANDPLTKDAAIISAAQKVEHYEIASYGTLVAFAKAIGENQVIYLLEQILEEEKKADRTLTSLAEASINLESAH